MVPLIKMNNPDIYLSSFNCILFSAPNDFRSVALKHLAKFKNIGGTFIEVSVESKEEGYEEYPLKNPTRENLYTTDPTRRTNKDNQ